MRWTDGPGAGDASRPIDELDYGWLLRETLRLEQRPGLLGGAEYLLAEYGVGAQGHGVVQRALVRGGIVADAGWPERLARLRQYEGSPDGGAE